MKTPDPFHLQNYRFLKYLKIFIVGGGDLNV